ncbi:hypothetical protein F7725_014143 [Dissostichus mawsoni]|uniref:Uncharacterized protein n=1 Tax=Dissostichus mawsoni TaxID=36200 RepID=A0A7J5YVC3_DISMA|nr:hypothetical protein F7725_014143 [Dissostichus mawsoni]
MGKDSQTDRFLGYTAACFAKFCLSLKRRGKYFRPLSAETCDSERIRMTEQRLLFMDIEPKANGSTPADDRAEKPILSPSDNTFKFDFLCDTSPALQEKTSPSEGTEPAESQISFTGQSSAFTFNFKLPPVENMDTTETTSSTGSQPCVQEEKPPLLQEVISPPEQSEAKQKKKKNKSGRKNPADKTEGQKTPSSAEGSEGGEDTALCGGAAEQAAGLVHRAAGEEASRALKTLRSTKAPLAKKRQVMRAMTGDYRKKMDQEKSKQHKLIKTEHASAKVKEVSDTPKKSVFHRRADVKTQTPSTEDNLKQTEAQDKDLKAQTQEEKSAFVFTPSKEEFRFDFI